jgi:hypothetical protein
LRSGSVLPFLKADMPPKKAAKKAAKRKATPKKTPDDRDFYSDILAAMDQLLDSAEDDISRASMDPLAAVRAKCATLTVALRMSLLALSCHGQKKDFARQIAQNLEQIVQIKAQWDDIESQEKGQQVISEIAEKETKWPRPEKRQLKLVEEAEEDGDDYSGQIEAENQGFAEEDFGESDEEIH